MKNIKMKNLLMALVLFTTLNPLIGQVNGPPSPCTTGTQNTCKCQDAPVLCSIEELNGFEYDMTLYQHPADGPQPMCPPPQGSNTTSNNPTWFAFISWCTSLVLNVNYTDCLDLPGGPTSYGIQTAIYSGCPATPSNAVTCETSVTGCVQNGVRTLNINGMTPGNIYYLLVDGCGGSACHIKIDVIGSCSASGPGAFSNLTGPSALCKPAASDTFRVVKNGASTFYWYIDNVLVSSGLELVKPKLNLSSYSNGIHQVCVDGSNLPCLPVNTNPPPLCMDVCVAPSTANAGNINFNTPNCSQTNVPISVTGYNNASGFVQHVFITNTLGDIIQVIPNNGTTTTFANSPCQPFKVYSINYFGLCHSTIPSPMVGMNASLYENIASDCGYSISSRSATSATIIYPSSFDDFVNPERGWYRYSETRASNYTLLDSATIASYRSLHTPASPPANYSIYASLVFRYFVLDNFKTSNISASFLQNIQTDFNTARKAGVKIIPRFAYTIEPNTGSCGNWICPPYGDANKTWVLQHIAQLKPILQANADVIASVQMGFIGTWGENYYTDYFGDASQPPYQLTATNWSDRKQVLDSLLAAVPNDINVQVRYPQMKQKDIYGTSAPVTSAAMTLAESYTGSNKSRIGFHNDCFLANYDDFGTYANYDTGNSDTLHLKPYKAVDSKYTMVGGETCFPSTFGQCSNAFSEMSRMHYTYLNADYNNEVNNEWVANGCIFDIKLYLGYRLSFASATLPNNVVQGGALNYTINITNSGFSAPINKRKVVLVLVNPINNDVFEVVLPDDPRYWFEGIHSISGSVAIPACMPPANYNMYLKLADPSPSLYNRPEYAIRLANNNTWIADKGYNSLQHTITVIQGSGSNTSSYSFGRTGFNKWIGPAVGHWNTSASNWSLGRLPDLCDDVLIETGKTVTVPSAYSAFAKSVTVNSGGNLRVLNGGNLEVLK